MATAAEMSTHPAIDRALQLAARNDPAASSRAAASAERLLEGRIAAGPAGFTGSTLSMDGFPLEIAFSSGDPALRYTVDFGAPGSDPHAVTARAVEWVESCGAPLPQELLGQALALQRGTLRFGAYIGGRHGAGGDRCKLYCEVPAEQHTSAQNFTEELLGSQTVLPNRPQRVEMIALDPVGRRVELYTRIEGMTTPEVAVLLGRAGLRARYSELFALLQDHYPFSMRYQLPGNVFGFSYSVPFDGDGQVAFTLYTYARTMFGWDAKIRAMLLRIGRERQWDLSFYEQLSEPLTWSNGAVTSHTMFGVTVAGELPLAVNFGLRPPEPS